MVIVFFYLLFLFILFDFYVKNDLKSKGLNSIGKYVYYRAWAKGDSNYFEFYVDSIRYKSNGGRVPKLFHNNIGKFYRIKYSKKYKRHVIVDFSQEVKDTSEILKAGFTKEEINGTSKLKAKETSYKDEVLTIIGLK